MRCPLSLAHLAGVSALQIALVLLFFDPRWVAVPLGLFLLVSAGAPFLPWSSYYLPVVAHGSRKDRKVALSFDDGPDPRFTPRVLDLLDRHGIKAIFFLVGQKAEAHPDLVRAILDRGHELGNHSWAHEPWLMLRGARHLRQEVARTQDLLRGFGVLPRAFRPPVGITAPPLWPVLLEQGLSCVNFSRRAGDAGNRFIRNLAARILRKIRPGDLILLHDAAPAGCDLDHLLSEFDRLIQGLRERNLEIIPPSRLLGRSLMERTSGEKGVVAGFYDDLAATYDAEQFETAVSLSRRLELSLFERRLPHLLQAGDRVLDLGAGTGIFTLLMAPRCAEVHAVDVSANMLQRLQAKAQAAGLANIRTEVGDAETMPLRGPYALATAFLCFEYFRDLPAFLRRLAPLMAPGGRIYFMTARTSLFRTFTQIGNALRQGIWLKSRTRRELVSMLRDAGIQDVRCEPHLLKCLISGGMLWEVEGRWPDAPPDDHV